MIQSVNNAKIVKTTVTTERKQQKQDKDYFSNLWLWIHPKSGFTADTEQTEEENNSLK